jgi:hypothetical protein
MQNFSSSKNKFKYVYLLTPQDVAEKLTLTSRFLSRKMDEYEALKLEFAMFKSEIQKKEEKTISSLKRGVQ